MIDFDSELLMHLVSYGGIILVFVLIFGINMLSKRVGRDILADITACRDSVYTITEALKDGEITAEERVQIVEELRSIADIVTEYASIISASGMVTLIIKKYLK